MAVVNALILAGIIFAAGVLVCLGIEIWYAWSTHTAAGPRRRMSVARRLLERVRR